jgi:hypothetical protein
MLNVTLGGNGGQCVGGQFILRGPCGPYGLVSVTDPNNDDCLQQRMPRAIAKCLRGEELKTIVSVPEFLESNRLLHPSARSLARSTTATDWWLYSRVCPSLIHARTAVHHVDADAELSQ